MIANGDRDARNRLVQSNLRLVVRIACDFQGRGLSLDDLIGEGNLGLIRATEGFDPNFGTRFATYAAYWIKESIRSALINTTSTIRLPAHMFRLLTKWRRVERALARELGGPPSFEDVASVLGLSETQRMLVTQARQSLRFTLESSEALMTGRCAPVEPLNRSPACEATLEADEERRNLSHRMQRLETQEFTVLELRYGLRGKEPMTLKEIGHVLGVQREWVRKIETLPSASSATSRVIKPRPRRCGGGCQSPIKRSMTFTLVQCFLENCIREAASSTGAFSLVGFFGNSASEPRTGSSTCLIR